MENKMKNNYETVIGLEVHVELSTRTKLFCGCSAAFGGEPNQHTCPVCTGQPGTLPILNEKALELGCLVGLALHCSIAPESSFDRKNYFYPDNPQDYQITQFYHPFAREGWLALGQEQGGKRIRIHEIHLEEDAGKLIHDEEGKRSYVDYNRAGVPLIEIVTEPDMSSGEEVVAFLEKLMLTIRYLGASDCRLNEGSMRADVNLSIREQGASSLGTRTEMKNLNSFRAVTQAIEHEIKRQMELLAAGEAVVQETRRWDEARGASYPMRSKEDARDYRYFPEPDLPVVRVSETKLRELAASLPEFQEEKAARFQKEYNLPPLDARILTESRYLSELFEETVSLCGKPKKVSNWLMGEAMRLLNEDKKEPEELTFSPEHLAKLIELTENGTVNMTTAKEIFAQIYREDADPERLIREQGLHTVSDEGELRELVQSILTENEKSVRDYRNGKERAFGFLVGQTMKASGGRAEVATVRKILQELL